jgi:peptidoglycan/LPS O-acetylase OafA/YrhL
MTSPRHIPALTGIRAIAAGMVFYGHMLLGHMSEVPELMQYGWTGVNIFFALSGYLFTYLYSDKLFDGSFSWSDYIKRRIIRIYPLTSLLIIIAILSQWGEYSLGNIVTHLMLLHAWIPEYRLELISPMWTLSVEESFYFSAPVLIILLGLVFREVATRWSSVSKTYRSAVIILVAMALWLLILSFSAGATKL